jgi:hypothetical protein
MRTQERRGLGIVVVVIVIAVLCAIVGVGVYMAMNRQGQDRQQGNGGSQSNAGGSREAKSDDFAKQYGGNCDKSANPKFTTSPLALDKMASIEPLGKTSDGHVTPVDHVYIAPIDQNAADNTYDVVMPADGRIVDVGRMPAQYVGDKSDVKLAPDDFRITIAFSCRYYGILIHVHKLSDTLAKAVGTIEESKTKQVSVDLKAGELIAHLGGNPFDLTMVDTETTLPGLLTPSLYQGEPWKIHSVDPISLFTGEVKTALEAKSLRTTAPFGGKFDWDKKGALIGNWFKVGTKGYQGDSPDRYWDGHLSIAPNHIDPNAIIYSTGNWQGKAGQYVVKGDFDPATVTASSGVTKIEIIDAEYSLADGGQFSGGQFKRGMKLATTSDKVVGTVLLQVQDGEKLKVEQFPGKTAAQVTDFTSAAATYER